MDDKFVEAIKDFAKKNDNKITCSDAWSLADKFLVKRSDMADLLTKLNIKIIKCQLGCF